MTRKTFTLLFLTLCLLVSACAPTPSPTAEAQTTEEISVATDTPELQIPPTQTSEVSKTSEVLPSPTAIGTMNAETGGIDNLATIYLSPTGTLEAKINPDLGINANNPILLNLSQTPTYVFNLGSNNAYSFRVTPYTGNGYSIIVDNQNNPGRGKVAPAGPGKYSIEIRYEATETATGNTISGVLTIPLTATGSINAPNNGGNGGDGDNGGGTGGGGDEECTDPLGCDQGPG